MLLLRPTGSSGVSVRVADCNLQSLHVHFMLYGAWSPYKASASLFKTFKRLCGIPTAASKAGACKSESKTMRAIHIGVGRGCPANNTLSHTKVSRSKSLLLAPSVNGLTTVQLKTKRAQPDAAGCMAVANQA